MQRAKIFKKVSKNNKDNFFEFKNCFPRNFMPKKSNHLEKFLIKYRLKNKKIICHLGSIGPSHFIEQILDSGKYIQNEFIIIIAGSPIDRYQEKLKKKIDKLNLSKKIYIFENIIYGDDLDNQLDVIGAFKNELCVGWIYMNPEGFTAVPVMGIEDGLYPNYMEEVKNLITKLEAT